MGRTGSTTTWTPMIATTIEGEEAVSTATTWSETVAVGVETAETGVAATVTTVDGTTDEPRSTQPVYILPGY